MATGGMLCVTLATLRAKTRKYTAAVEEKRREEQRVRIPCTSNSDCIHGGIFFERLCRK